MPQSDHSEALRLLREDPRVIERSIDRARRLRAEACADLWGRARAAAGRLVGDLARRDRGQHSGCGARTQS